MALRQILSQNHALTDNPLRAIAPGRLLVSLAMILPLYVLALILQGTSMTNSVDWQIAKLFAIDAGFALLAAFILYRRAIRPAGAYLSDLMRLRDEKQSVLSTFWNGVSCYLAIVIVLFGVLALFVFPVCTIFQLNLPDQANDLDRFLENVFRYGSWWQRLALGIELCLLAPLVEELFFRGLIYGWLRTRLRILPATLASSLLFAALHFNLAGAIVFITCGVMAALAFEFSGKLTSAVTTHALWNATAIALTLYSSNINY